MASCGGCCDLRVSVPPWCNLRGSYMRWLITGGAGFIGCNAARRLVAEGHDVVVLDNLSRKGAAENLDSLRRQGPLAFVQAEVRNFAHLRRIFAEQFDVVLHLAAQVA